MENLHLKKKKSFIHSFMPCDKFQGLTVSVLELVQDGGGSFHHSKKKVIT